jgi:tetratricopeptide (TPR) repeat protein
MFELWLNVLAVVILFSMKCRFHQVLILGIQSANHLIRLAYLFFASKASIESTWVQFEINEADWRLSTQKMAGSLTILIDDETQQEGLPKWMQRNLVVRVQHPQLAVHTIKNYLLQLSTSRLQPIFVGRESDLQRISSNLIPQIGEKIPRIIVIAGLHGIGRRTFAQRAIKDYLSMDIGCRFVLEDNDSIDTLHIHLLNQTADLSKRDYLASLLDKFRKLDPIDKGKETARLITIINQNNQIPVIIDTGPRGILLDEFTGWYRDEWQHLFRALESFRETYLLLIQPRIPNFRDSAQTRADMPQFAIERLQPLSTEAIKLIFRESVHRTALSLNATQIDELAPYIAGYPPAAKFALGYIQMYGIDALLAEKAALTDFLAHQFDKILVKLVLAREEQYILKLLASHTSLSLECFSSLLEISSDKTAHFIRHLVDINLVVPIDSEYSISSPIASAVRRTFDPLITSDYARIARVLKSVFWTDPENLPALSTIDLTIHALAYSDIEELNNFRDLVLPSQLLKVAWQKYNEADWTGAIDIADRTLTLEPTMHRARIVKFKALVRLNSWQQAEVILKEIDGYNSVDRFYLRGFMQWKRGQYDSAVKLFHRGLNAGDHSLALERDLACCLMVLGQLDEAKRHSDVTIGRARNFYTLDLAAQIAIYSNRIPDAEAYIKELEFIDDKAYYHRLATLEKCQGHLEQALVSSEKACDCEYPRFEALVQKADILIDLNRHDAETIINRLNPSFSISSDMKKALLCKLHYKRVEWGPAHKIWKGIWQKSHPAFRNIRKGMLDKMISDPLIDPIQREQAITEYQSISETSYLSISEGDAQDIS